MLRQAVRLSLVALSAVLALSMSGCGGAAKKVAPGEEVNLRVGEKFELSLEANPSTGFSWRVRDDAGGCLAAVGEPVYLPGTASTSEVDGIGAVTFTFEAKRAGEGDLIIDYRRRYERLAEPAKSVSIPIVVK